MEFIRFEEASQALEDLGIEASVRENDCLYLSPGSHEPLNEVRHLHLADPQSTSSPRDGARVVNMPRAHLADAIDNMIGQLHLTQLLLLPVGKWRAVFDAVAFSLASNEDWQEIDAMATVELNTRDPLLCNPGDYHTLHALVSAIFQDAESPQQGITITSPATPFIAEVIPDGAVRVMIGNAVLADEIEEGLHI